MKLYHNHIENSYWTDFDRLVAHMETQGWTLDARPNEYPDGVPQKNLMGQFSRPIDGVGFWKNDNDIIEGGRQITMVSEIETKD